MSAIVTQAMIDRFLTWPLPESVCADLCATSPGWSNRIGTNLLTATEAKQMLEYVLAAPAVATRQQWFGDKNGVFQEMPIKIINTISATPAAPTSLLYTTRQYPCGCRAEGAGDIPAYCAEHGIPPATNGATVPQVEPFKREPRYVVFKIKDIQAYCSESIRGTIEEIGRLIAHGRDYEGKPPFNAVVVEQDWPEFEPTWAAIEARMAGKDAAPTSTILIHGNTFTLPTEEAQRLVRALNAELYEAADAKDEAKWQHEKNSEIYGRLCKAESALASEQSVNKQAIKELRDLQVDFANAEQRIREFDSCIQKVAAALHACCGGVDGDQTQEGATTRVLLEKIDALKAGIRPIA